jgi:hypothetical protein
LSKEVEGLRPSICEEARGRFRNWLGAAQAETLPITLQQSRLALNAYFEGTPPFDRPKNRDHLPDAFIYTSILDLIARGDDVWCLTGDSRLSEALEATRKIRVYRDYYPLFTELLIPFDYSREQKLTIGRLDASFTTEAERCLFDDLRGQSLRFQTTGSSISPKIREVLRIRNLVTDHGSIMYIDDNTLLIGFECDADVTGAERITEKHEIIERLSEISVAMRGHFVVVTFPVDNGIRKIKAIELDDFEIGSAEQKAANKVVTSIPPDVGVAAGWATAFEKVVSNDSAGLVVVIGSTLRNRRLVAEYIVAARTRRNEVSVLNFQPLTKNIPFVETQEDEIEEFWERAQNTEAHVLGFSAENVAWEIAAIFHLSQRKCFIVGTMKSASSRSAVIRAIAALPNGKNNLGVLLAVAWIQDVSSELITFAISQHGGWGDGNWETILERDELLKKSRE